MKFRCFNNRCPGRNGNDAFEFESTLATCPKCRAGIPAVCVVRTIHFQRPDESGIVQGEHGVRFSVACNPSADIARVDNAGHMLTTEWFAVSCPKCVKNPVWIHTAASAYTAIQSRDVAGMFLPPITPEAMAAILEEVEANANRYVCGGSL
jgi:Zn finger protein HypA/HybF involved in hydrogenase expression